MNNENNKNMGGLATLLKTMVAPIAWDDGMKDVVVSGIEKTIGDKLTDKEIRIAKAAWCHGFSADPREVMDKTLESIKGECEDD